MAVLEGLKKRIKGVITTGNRSDSAAVGIEPLGRKRRSLMIGEGTDFRTGGVFVSTRHLTTIKESSSDDDHTSPATSWKSSGSKDHNKNSPLLVVDPESSVELGDEMEALGRAMARSRKLPGTWYYSSNHIMVNNERSKSAIAPLYRLRELDEIARAQAENMASSLSLSHSSPQELQSKFSRKTRRLGENIARGETIRSMHQLMMMNRSDRNNILDRRFTHMGMATARGADGNLYMCQVFRG